MTTANKASGLAQNGPGKLRAFLGTELGRVIPLSTRSPRTWVGALEDAALPKEIDGAIRVIVTKTKLWGGEKLDVAQELISHALEGLESGCDPAELAKVMGDSGRVAKLIRRAMKRKRHWTWHARVWAFRITAGTAGAATLVAGLGAARFYTATPTPKRNFIAEMNAPFDRFGDGERSWMLVREANVAIASTLGGRDEEMRKRADVREGSGELTKEQLKLGFHQSGIDARQSLDPSHPDYEETVALLSEVRPALETVREAASRPVLGYLFSTKTSNEDKSTMPEGWFANPVRDSDDPAQQGLLVEVLLPALGPIRNQSKWLAFDALVAAREGDAELVRANLDAMFGFASQANQDRLLISNLVAASIVESAETTLSRVLIENPDLLSQDDLVALAHGFGKARSMFDRLPLQGEINMFEDVLQRAYTDDGSGDGHLTNEGLEILQLVGALGSSPNVFDNMGDAINVAVNGSRAQERKTYHTMISLLREDEEAGYEVFRGRELKSTSWFNKIESDERFSTARLLLPAFGRVIQVQARRRAGIDSTLVAIGAELYRRDMGFMPSAVHEMVPRYLPSAPEDPFTGAPMMLALRDDGGVTVYCTGPDLDDDGGTTAGADEKDLRPRTSTSWDNTEASDGDWVLYPFR